MCDVRKYEKIYEDIQKLQPEDTLQLVLEAETEEQRNFYEMVGDFLLQKKQRQVIVLSCKLDAPAPCRLDAPDFSFVCHVLADCLHQH